MTMRRLLLVLVGGWLCLSSTLAADEPLRIGVFDVDASPPVGSPMAYDPTDEVLIPLSCRGIVIVGAGQPIVLCAIDWIGVANESHAAFRGALAEAAGTSPARVAVHALHQHDAPACDFSADRLLAQQGISHHFYDTPFARQVMRRAAEAVARAKEQAVPVTHVGLGEAEVEKVASNRRILGEDGKVQHVRWTATTDPAIRAAPVGTIDPLLKMISFWQEDHAVAALTYYATHPQSYYRTRQANPDFPGIARNARQDATGVPHIHFNGAGGNIGAGKWNDGSPENRQVLADRVAAGMRKAWQQTEKRPIGASEVAWRSVPVDLPAAPHLNATSLEQVLADASAPILARASAARDLAWLRRGGEKASIEVSCLRLANARVLHLPGELFVEYQLAAQGMREDLFVAMAAYGDYGPGYIGTKVAYSQGGYETSPPASRVAPGVEEVLTRAIRALLVEEQVASSDDAAR